MNITKKKKEKKRGGGGEGLEGAKKIKNKQ